MRVLGVMRVLGMLRVLRRAFVGPRFAAAAPALPAFERLRVAGLDGLVGETFRAGGLGVAGGLLIEQGLPLVARRGVAALGGEQDALKREHFGEGGVIDEAVAAALLRRLREAAVRVQQGDCREERGLGHVQPLRERVEHGAGDVLAVDSAVRGVRLLTPELLEKQGVVQACRADPVCDFGLVRGGVERRQVLPERRLRAVGLTDEIVDVGQQVLQQLELPEELERPAGGLVREQAVDLFADARDRGVQHVRVVLEDGLAAGAVDLEAEARRELDRPHHADRVLAEADVGVADAAQHALFQIFQPADIVDDGERLDVVEEAVDREVAPLGVLFGGAEGVVVGLIDAAFALALVGLAAERAGFNDLAPENDVGQAEAPPDEKTVAEEAADVVRAGVGADVEILGGAAEQEVADAAADQVGEVPRVGEPVEDFECVGVDVGP